MLTPRVTELVRQGHTATHALRPRETQTEPPSSPAASPERIALRKIPS